MLHALDHQIGRAGEHVTPIAGKLGGRGGADRRHEFVQCLGRILQRLSSTREAYLEHENAKVELKGLMPEDAKEAIGHGIRAKRSKSGAVSFEVLSVEAALAQVQ